MLVTTSETAARLGLRPLARLHSFAVTGSDPLLMLTGVIPATEKVLRRAGLRLADIDLFEVNEAGPRRDSRSSPYSNPAPGDRAPAS
ncbi:hypothetical protein [Sphaerisporangium perillae]|uniref:hypothetical protein n=1 Tax=Sphaerisporangium perillae TaxID=2935860 RepID=UPI003FD73F81